MRGLASAVLLSMPLAACASAPQMHNAQLVKVELVIAALKCAFAQALVKERAGESYDRLWGRVASGTITLNVVDDSKYGAGIEAKPAGPFVFALGSAPGSILPHLKGTVQRTNTIRTAVDFRLGLKADSAAVCETIPDRDRQAFAFEEWLSRLVSGFDQNAGYEPYGQIDKIEYEANFAVVASSEAGAKFDVVLVGGNLSLVNERKDIQHIKFTVQGVKKDNPYPTARRFRHGGGRPPLVPPVTVGPTMQPPKPGEDETHLGPTTTEPAAF